MKISLESLEVDGVGPFTKSEKIDLGEAAKVVVFAPNGHGKTATIDLVRWLLQGERAKEHFKTLNADMILNRERWAERGQGSVTATIDIEGRGRHRIKRIEALGKPRSQLVVQRWSDERAAYEEVPNGELFLLRFFPPERVGFNLLTGEHIQAFQDQLTGEDVRRSIERLLAIPELASAQELLKELAEDLESQHAKHQKAVKKSKDAEDTANRLREALAKNKSIREEAAATLLRLKEEASALDQQIGRLKAGTASRAAYNSARDAAEAKAKELGTLREEARERLAQSWRRLAVKAARPDIDSVVKAQDKYEAAHGEWKGQQGQLKLFQEIMDRKECFCLRPIDANARKRLEAEIKKIQSREPEAPPEIGVTNWTLRSWKEDDRFDGLVSSLASIVEKASQVRSDKNKFEAEMQSIEKALDKGSLKEIDRLDAERAKLEEQRVQATNKKDAAVARLAELQRDLEDADRMSGKGKGHANPGSVASLARAYADTFRDVIEEAIPLYREQLQAKVQSVFRKLYQKDPKAIVEFDQRSCVPRVKLPSEHDRLATHGQMSDGEKMRLGLALLIGLREVASEKPFLMLDAPFSELDDEGIVSLLEVIAGMDSQVIIFTKNRLKSEEYDLVKEMEPKVFRMDWTTKAGRNTQGYTSWSKDTIESLDAEEA